MKYESASMVKWDKVFKNRPSKICGSQPLKNFKGYTSLPKVDHTTKGCVPQILLGPFLNTLTQKKKKMTLHYIKISLHQTFG